MDLILKLVLGLILGAVAGYVIDRLSKRFINETEDRIKDYNLNRKVVITAIVIFTIADFLIFGWIGFLKYSLIGFVLLLIGIIDYYTHYVYLIIAIPGIIIALILGVYFNGVYSIVIQIPLFFILFIMAYFSNKFYGDVEALIIIGFSFGLNSLVIFTIGAFLFSFPELIKNRKVKRYSIAFCAYLAIAYVGLHIVQVILSII